MARESGYTPEIAEEICEWLCEGRTLREWCRNLKEDGSRRPSFRTVYVWKENNPEFAARFAHAREIGGDFIAEEIKEIMDTPMIGETIESSESSMKVTKADMLGHRRLQVEGRMKLLAVWFPRKFGQRIDLTSNGEPLNLTPEERRDKLARLKAAAAHRKAGTVPPEAAGESDDAALK